MKIALVACVGLLSRTLVFSEDAPRESWIKVGAAAVEIPADDSMVIGGGIGPGGAQGQEGKLRPWVSKIL